METNADTATEGEDVKLKAKPQRRRAPYKPKPARPYAEGRAHKQGRNRVDDEPLVVVAVRVSAPVAAWLAGRARSRSAALRALADDAYRAENA